MKLIVTIDTEEDNWGAFTSKPGALSNIERIPALQELFDHFKVKPTYLVTYPVVSDPAARAILRTILEAGKCEIGAHCHPWNTPPFDGPQDRVASMLCNLPTGLQRAKVQRLRDAIQSRFGLEPLSFRSGRFGYGTSVAQNLVRLGYQVDTSVTPYTDWTKEHGPDFTDVSPRPFRCSRANPFRERPNGELLEVPATIGFLQENFDRSRRILRILKCRSLKSLRLGGILHRLRLLNKVWLSPEVSTSQEMIRLAENMKKNHHRILNMVFHSPSLKAGLTPFVKSVGDEKIFFQKLRDFLTFATQAGIQPIRLCDVQKIL